MDRPPQQRQAAYLAMATACVLWGTSFIFGKVALRELQPSQVVLGRFILASVILMPVSLRICRRRLTGHDTLLFFLSGALMVPASFLLQFEGLERTSATSAALIVGALPPLLAVIAYLVDGERLSRSGWMAVVASTGGVALLIGLPGPGRTLTGDLIVAASMVTTSAWILLTRRLLRRWPPVVVTAWSAGMGTLLLLLTMWGRGKALLPADLSSLSSATWGAVGALGVLCTALTFILWTWGLRVVPSTKAGAFINFEPLVGALLGIALLGDAAGPHTALGGTLVLGAAWVVSRQ